jgi:hypothetical protein
MKSENKLRQKAYVSGVFVSFLPAVFSCLYWQDDKPLLMRAQMLKPVLSREYVQEGIQSSTTTMQIHRSVAAVSYGLKVLKNVF